MATAIDSSKCVFDGVQPVTLCTPDPGVAVELYTAGLGFRALPSVRLPARPWRELWDLPTGGDLTVTDLVKDGAHGGGIRIVQVPELPVLQGGRLPDVSGPYAWDFYVRDIDRTIERLQEMGWSLRSEPQRYRLFGQDFEVLECMLEGPQGLLHALVEYIPNRHRCVLAQDDRHEVSEVIATVFVVPSVTEPLKAMTASLGADVAMDEVFAGPEIEALLDLPVGSSFRMALMRGPSRRSARFELLESIAGPEASPFDGACPHVIAPMPVSDPAASAAAMFECGAVVREFRSSALSGAIRVELASGVKLLLVSEVFALT